MTEDHLFPDAAWRRQFRSRLLGWFGRHARDLPWRRCRDAYRVWVSEIMLQQTQVATVVPYFERFIARFPDVRSLAEADLQEVLRMWEGLGYYRRARQLHQAAQVVVARHGGTIPRDAEALRALPGIGRYTAGAILSIAWDAPQAVLEANTIRLLSRLVAYREDPTRSSGQRLLWSLAEQLLPRTGTGAFNQALMELGSELCTPRAPQCERCPVAALCPTQAQGLQAVIPAPKRKTAYEQIQEAAVVIRRGPQVLLRRCQAGQRWAGLWDFPRFAVTDGDPQLLLQGELAEKTRQLTGLTVRPQQHLTTIKHSVTRFRITLLCYDALWQAGSIHGDQMQWVEPAGLDPFPLSVSGRKISRLLVKE